jgi:phosphoglycerate dehydrogenase-like enzyme
MARKKILVLSPLPEAVVEALFAAQAGDSGLEIEAHTWAGGSQDDLKRAVEGADVIIGDYTNNVAMDAEVMRAAKGCRLIQQPSTGYQHLDVEEAARQGIPVASAAGANALSVAEHTIMMILACLKKLMLAHEKTRRAEWAQDEMANYGVFELFGKTIGIVGMGRIGKEVARRAGVFGANMLYYDVVRLEHEEERELGLTFRTLDELLAESDVVSLHAPSTPETHNMMNRERIGMMKQGAVLINVARGDLVDEAALADALAEGRLQGAALDVFSVEPVEPDNPLLEAPYTILTPHIAGATNESRMRIIMLSMSNVVAVLSGRTPANIVNGVEPPG